MRGLRNPNRARRRMSLVSIITVGAMAGLLLASAACAQNADVVAHDAWARVPLKASMDTAVYFVIENHTAQPREIISVSTDAAAHAELHQMTMVKMMMVMTPVSQVAVPSHSKTSFDPNSFHVMLFGLSRRERFIRTASEFFGMFIIPKELLSLTCMTSTTIN